MYNVDIHIIPTADEFGDILLLSANVSLVQVIIVHSTDELMKDCTWIKTAASVRWCD